MADISRVVLPDEAQYNIKDATARDGLTKKSDVGHTHSASDITSGILDAGVLPSIPATKLTGTISSDNLPDDLTGAISSITRDGTTYTATRLDGTTVTFDQQDTTYEPATASTDGLMSADDKSTLDGIKDQLDSLGALTQEFNDLRAHAIVTQTYNTDDEDLTTISGLSAAFVNLRTHMFWDESD